MEILKCPDCGQCETLAWLATEKANPADDNNRQLCKQISGARQVGFHRKQSAEQKRCQEQAGAKVSTALIHTQHEILCRLFISLLMGPTVQSEALLQLPHCFGFQAFFCFWFTLHRHFLRVFSLALSYLEQLRDSSEDQHFLCYHPMSPWAATSGHSNI